MPQLSTLPLLSTMPLPQLTPPPLSLPLPTNLSLPLPTNLHRPLMLSPRARTSPTPTSTELLMTTPRLTSTLLRLLMAQVLLLDHTPLLFLMAVPSMSSTPQIITTDMLLRSPMRESLLTLRPSLMLQPLPTMLKPYAPAPA